ncbi:MAG: hypothetical protein IT459_06775, partial [Planctomycetes bacterium]|nr:hypothetical protein [Planctomycetota bacterium]
MERRDFLQWMAAGAGGLAASRLMFADERKDAVDFDELVKTQLARATKRGCPVIAVVVPKAYRDQSERGDVITAWFDSADDAKLADLALVEFVCAPLDALRRAPIDGLDDEAWWFVLNPKPKEPAESTTSDPTPNAERQRWSASPVRFVLPRPHRPWLEEDPEPGAESDGAPRESWHDEVARIAHAKYRAALRLDRGLDAIAARARETLDAELRMRVAEAIDDPATLAAEDLALAAEDLAFAAVLVRVQAIGDAKREAAAQAALAESARRRLR